MPWLAESWCDPQGAKLPGVAGGHLELQTPKKDGLIFEVIPESRPSALVEYPCELRASGKCLRMAGLYEIDPVQSKKSASEHSS